MQIIPRTQMGEPASFLNNKKSTNGMGIDSYASYTSPYLYENALLEANKGLISQEEPRVSDEKMLSYEEVMRLRNELLEEKKITEEEANAISYYIEMGGQYSVLDIKEAIAGGVQGVHALTPDEYVAVQKFLYGIGFETQEIGSILQNIQSGKTSDAIQTIGEKVLAFQEMGKKLPNVIPLLTKLFTGQQMPDALSDSMRDTVDNKEMVQELEKLFADSAKNINEKTLESIDIQKEVAMLLQQRATKEIAEKNASSQINSATQAEANRQNISATQSLFSTFYTITEEGSTTQQEGSFSEQQHSMYSEKEQAFLSKMYTTVSNATEHGSVTYNTVSTQMLKTMEKQVEQRMPASYKAETLATVEKGLLEIYRTSDSTLGSTLTVELNPHNLGKVELSLQYKDGQLSAILRPTTTDTQKTLEDSIATLTKSLDEQGIKIERITITEGKDQWLQGNGYKNPEQQHEQPGSHAKEEAGTQEIERVGRIRSLLLQAGKKQNETVAVRTKRLLDRIA